MARGLLGLVQQGEKAYAYSHGGDDIVVGFFENTARYLAVLRKRGPKTTFSPAEMSSILSLNAPPTKWITETSTQSPPKQTRASQGIKKTTPSPERLSTYFSFADQSGSMIGWKPGDKPFVFFLLPAYSGQPHLLLNEWQIARAIG